MLERKKPVKIPFYGRRKGRSLSRQKQDLVETLLPELSLFRTGTRAESTLFLPNFLQKSGDFKPDKNTISQNNIDKKNLFPQAKEVWLEIGFGGGEHLLYQAQNHPDIGLVGVEPFLNGVAKILVNIDTFKIPNIRLHHGLIQEVLPYCSTNFFSRIFILFPDPWPKKRHIQRRLISSGFAHELARVLRHGGILRLASDIPLYLDTVIPNILNQGNFQHSEFHRHTEPQPNLSRHSEYLPTTRYEQKALSEGRLPVYLEFLCQKG